MSEILQSLKSDLLDRRLLPILLALALALLAALAYALFAGGGSAKPVALAAALPRPVSQGPTLPVAQAPADPHAAVAETTEGAPYRHHAGARNPFTPLPSPKLPTSTAGAATKPSSTPAESKSGGSSSTGAGSSGGGTTTPSQPSTPPAPKPKPKPKPAFIVKLEYGPLPAAPAEPQLTPFEVRTRRPLPSASDPRIVFTGVHGTPFEATFTLGREAILKGQGVCMPSTSQCEAIDLAAGKSEQLEYLEPTGQTVTYELKILSIARPEGASAASIARRRHHGHRHHG